MNGDVDFAGAEPVVGEALITSGTEADLRALAELDARPNTGQRIARAAGQGSVGFSLVELGQAFDWLGSDRWTPEQAAERWPAITAVVVVLSSTAHNVIPAVGRFVAEWWSRRHPEQ